jgi:large subunit ribosomal protein L9
VRILFLEDVTNVALAGEIKEVKSGFARNYLLPKGLATIATPDQVRRIEKIQKIADAKRSVQTKEATSIAKKIDGAILALSGRVGPTGQYYGSISVAAILEHLKESTGQTIERRMVELNESIKQPGSYDINIQLLQNVSASIKIVASGEGQEDLLLEEDVPDIAEVYESDNEETRLRPEADNDSVPLTSSNKPTAIDEQSDETEISAGE